MGEWISVKDKLPDLGEPVLIYSYPNIEIGCVDTDDTGENVWYLQNVGLIDIGWYTHWMPLPEPPKE